MWPGAVLADPLPASPLALIQQTAADVAERRQLPLLFPIDAAAFSEDELTARMKQSLADDYSDAEIRGDTATLVALGFAQPNIDLEQTYLGIFVEQIGGFYDPEDRTLILVQRADGDAAMEHVVVEHELVHALQDQNFGLSTLDDNPFDDSDVETALRALVEGDASFFNVLTMAGDFVGDISSLPLGNGGAAVSGDPDSALIQAPDLLSRTLVFPYIQGAAFVQAVHATDGFRAVNSAYRSSPPLSTEQILHPTRYLSIVPDWPVQLTLPDLSDLLPPGSELIDHDTLGELGMLSWLESVGGQDVVGAPLGWGGDRFQTWATPDGDVLVWFTTWDSPNDAQRFEVSARGTIEASRAGRWRRDGTLKTRQSNGVSVRRSGSDVVIVLGAQRKQSRALDARLQGATTRKIRDSLPVFSLPAVK